MTSAFTRPLTIEEAAEDEAIDKLEAKMKGKGHAASSRCPFCRNRAKVESTDHPIGESYVTEFHYIDCGLCGIIVDCRTCYRYYLHEPERHPCLELVDLSKACACPKSSGTTAPVETDDPLL